MTDKVEKWVFGKVNALQLDIYEWSHKAPLNNLGFASWLAGKISAMLRAALADPECNEALQEVKVLRRIPKGEVWYWQGDGYDFPESLACPVIMDADTCRELAAALRDKERLDWLMNRGLACKNEGGGFTRLFNNREAVDAAMSSSQPPAQLCANCGKPYDAHLLHDGNKCSLGSINGWFPKSVADALTKASQPPAQEKESQG